MMRQSRRDRTGRGIIFKGCILGLSIFFIADFLGPFWFADFSEGDGIWKTEGLLGSLELLEVQAGQEQWVFDEGDLLSLSQEQQLEEKAEALFQDTGYEFFVVTLGDAGGKTSREAAEDFYMEHQTGQDGAVYLSQ